MVLPCSQRFGEKEVRAGTAIPGIKLSEFHLDGAIAQVLAKNALEPEIHQAIQEVFNSLHLVLQPHLGYILARILQRLIEPERTVAFQVCRQADHGKRDVNRGFAIQMDSAIGGDNSELRFHTSVQPVQCQGFPGGCILYGSANAANPGGAPTTGLEAVVAEPYEFNPRRGRSGGCTTSRLLSRRTGPKRQQHQERQATEDVALWHGTT